MAWTWSAPQRGRIAGAAAVVGGHKVLAHALQRGAMRLGRGDAARGFCIGFAAFLTVAGAAAPNLSPDAIAAILFISGATLVLYAAMPSANAAADRHAPRPSIAPPAARQQLAAEPPAASLHELLGHCRTTTATDRAAFARLTAHMSHELRTPLNAIIGFSELMSNEVFGPLGSSSYAAYARDIHASGISLLKSAEDALAITALLTSTDLPHRKTQTHAASAAAEALAFHAPRFASVRMLAHNTVDTSAELFADPQAVRQLLINLVDDATDAATPGAAIAIASRADGTEMEICISVTGCSAAPSQTGGGFSMLLARTLAELCGAKLTASATLADGAHERHVTARFQLAAQDDLFV